MHFVIDVKLYKVMCLFVNWFLGIFDTGNFLVSKEPPHRPILLDFGLTKKLSNSFKQALAKMFLASAEVCAKV